MTHRADDPINPLGKQLASGSDCLKRMNTLAPLPSVTFRHDPTPLRLARLTK